MFIAVLPGRSGAVADCRCGGVDGIKGVVEGAGGVVFAEFDAFEEGLIVEPSNGWFSCEVAVVAILGVLERDVQVVVDLRAGGDGHGQLFVDGGELSGDPVLFGFE
ncbi:hypothetical protein [Gordonia polyisoprenivorans]|uniref:hypothetical protein n=1 Tax=Gordonia polyisoprenivorans TaxID=84595 RepID=UPI001AD71FAA|nr:hypothetical protein [Gordonia polyisoprenivorans]QTI66737.1 hypothetical protein J6U32_13660 [Gordonia polyisoprenivorans]